MDDLEPGHCTAAMIMWTLHCESNIVFAVQCYTVTSSAEHASMKDDLDENESKLQSKDIK